MPFAVSIQTGTTVAPAGLVFRAAAVPNVIAAITATAAGALIAFYLRPGKRKLRAPTITPRKYFYNQVWLSWNQFVESIDPNEVTKLLRAWGGGDRAALDALTPQVYGELHRIAARYMRNEWEGRTMQATALVNEVYVRMVDVTSADWHDRAHFFAVSATMMRRILVDQARARGAARRGGGRPMNLDDAPEVAAPGRDNEMVALDDALNALAEMDPRKAKVIELRFFGGLSVEETASVLGISEQSVMRDWKLARAWLYGEIRK
jgi:RNA polymerase sigma factor (TIGR02999 family)